MSTGYQCLERKTPLLVRSSAQLSYELFRLSFSAVFTIASQVVHTFMEMLFREKMGKGRLQVFSPPKSRLDEPGEEYLHRQHETG